MSANHESAGDNRMTPEAYARVVTLFEDSSVLPAASRGAWLDRECGGDESLLAAVHEMIASESGQKNLLDDTIETLAGTLFEQAPPRKLVGTTLGGYRILSRLGAGGMGEVFLAEDVDLGRKAALKLLPEDRATNLEWVTRFQKEARTVSALNHPGIVTIYGLGRAEDVYFIATEYIEGQTLREKSGALDTEARIDVVKQAALALAAAHDAGIVHRDVKPENILIRPDGLVKILDFGLAETTSAAPGDHGGPLNLEHLIMGTPHYMSPEQIVGGPVDARSDIFSLGVVFYELLAGRKPFAGDTLKRVLASTVNDTPARLAELRPDLPAPLCAAVEKAMEKDAEKRYTCMREFATDLIPRTRSSSLRWLLAVAASTVVGLALWAGIATNSAPKLRGIALLPLKDLSGDPEQQYFVEGMTEQLITDLSKIGSLRVISRPSAMHYLSEQRDLRAIARELKVDLLLTGSILRAGGHIRLSVQLMQMPEEKNLWAESYDGDLRDILSLQAGLARKVATQIRVTLTPQEQSRLVSVPQVDPETHQLYLQGKFFVNRGTEDGLSKGIAYFERAIARKPDYADAYSGLSSGYAQLASFYQPPRETMPKARDAALKAVSLDPSLAEPHISLGMVKLYYDWDWPGAEQELKRALELNPSSADAHFLYEDLLSALGRLDEALSEAEQSLSLDPLSVRNLIEAQFTNLLAERNSKAISLGQRLAEIEPTISWGHVNSGLAYAQQGALPKALTELETAVRLEPENPTAKAFLAHIRALAGDRAGAHKLLDELKALNAKRYVCAFEIATAYASLGENDEAFRWLDKGVRDRADCMIWMKREPWMRSLQKDGRFQGIAAKVGLP